ncbi:hypothetical protein X764_29315 [Mesorhizobium sp. LSHC440A00]|nr:hypothetical protein X764_29315 [Mesorhizobium sp. LSHC440A00]
MIADPELTDVIAYLREGEFLHINRVAEASIRIHGVEQPGQAHSPFRRTEEILLHVSPFVIIQKIGDFAQLQARLKVDLAPNGLEKFTTPARASISTTHRKQDHRRIKRRYRSMLGFRSTTTAEIIHSGIEMVHMMRKRQARFAYKSHALHCQAVRNARRMGAA